MRLSLSFAALLCLLTPAVICRADTDSFWSPASWTTSDGVHLIGHYHPASKNEAPTWILLHGLGSTKEEWNDFAVQVAAHGAGILAYDLRGHGESTKTSSGEIHYQDWRGPESAPSWAKMVDDLKSAVDYVHRTDHVSPKRIALGGASLGANVVLAYAGNHREVPAIILLSPGLSYAGIESQRPFADYGSRPALLAASPDDQYAYMSVAALSRTRGDGQLYVLQGPGANHGVQMFIDPTFTKSILNWMDTLQSLWK